MLDQVTPSLTSYTGTHIAIDWDAQVSGKDRLYERKHARHERLHHGPALPLTPEVKVLPPLPLKPLPLKPLPLTREVKLHPPTAEVPPRAGAVSARRQQVKVHPLTPEAPPVKLHPLTP